MTTHKLIRALYWLTSCRCLTGNQCSIKTMSVRAPPHSSCSVSIPMCSYPPGSCHHTVTDIEPLASPRDRIGQFKWRRAAFGAVGCSEQFPLGCVCCACLIDLPVLLLGSDCQMPGAGNQKKQSAGSARQSTMLYSPAVRRCAHLSQLPWPNPTLPAPRSAVASQRSRHLPALQWGQR